MLALLLSSVAGWQQLTTAETLDKVREAVDYEAFAAGAAYAVEGTATFLDREAAYKLSFQPDGAFSERVEGVLSQSRGFDGTQLWETDWSGVPISLTFEEHDLVTLVLSFRTHAWLAEDGPLEILRESILDSGDVELVVRPKDGLLEQTVVIDGSTWLPVSARIATALWTATVRSCPPTAASGRMTGMQSPVLTGRSRTPTWTSGVTPVHVLPHQPDRSV